MIKRKYKFNVKISKSSASNAAVLKNKKVERNAITRNQKFEQIEQTEIIQNKKKHFSAVLSTTTTHAKKILFVFVDLFTQLILKSTSIFILHVQLSTSIFSKIFFTSISNCFTLDFLTSLLNLH